MNKAIKYRIYPTTEQAVMFLKTFGCCRKVYNLMLSDKIESYKSTGKFAVVTPAKYKKDYPYLKEVDSLALANVQLDLQDAFGSCFSKSRKTNNGFPKFKSAKRSRKSYTTNCQYPKASNKLKQPTIRISDKSITLPRLAVLKRSSIAYPWMVGYSNPPLFPWTVMGSSMFPACLSMKSLLLSTV